MTDARTAPTVPFDRTTPAHAALARLVGAWEGPTKTWLDPTAEPSVSMTRAKGELLLDGRFLELDTAGTLLDKPHAGRFVVGYHADAEELVGVWIDSYHTGTDLMACKGTRRADGALELSGTYGAGAERWGWRTSITLTDDILVIDATNIAPDGTEDRAIQTTLRRIAS